MTSNLNSLLKFRFQRQPKTAPEIVPDSPIITIEDCTPTSSPTTPDRTVQSQASTVSPSDSQYDQTPGVSSPPTPVFHARHAKKQIILDSDDEETVVNGDAQNSPAWMSKKMAMEDNSACKSNRQHDSSASSSQFSENYIPDKRRLCRRVISVCSSDEDDTPTTSAVNSASAQDVNSDPAESECTKRSLDDDSEDISQPVGRPRKRIRMMSSSDSEPSHSLPPTPAKSQATGAAHSPFKPGTPPSSVRHKKGTRASAPVATMAELPDAVLDNEDDDEDMDDSGDEAETVSQSSIIVTFFDTATLGELAAMPCSSKKTAELIISRRPFGTYETLMSEFTATKGLSFRIISGCWEIIQIRETVVKLMLRCEKISERLDSVVGNLATQARLDDRHVASDQPECITDGLTLQPYQLIGLTWLKEMYHHAVDGILADEMGLGKTIQAIAFMAHLLENGQKTPHVVIVPASVIENWRREFEKWCPSLNICVYYGSMDERKAMRFRILHEGCIDFHVLLTTYTMATGSVEDRSLFKKCSFHYAVFDEGHLLKNMSSQRYKHLMKIQAERRLLLTGTPLQNNLLELVSLLSFVVPNIFIGKTEHLKKVFTMVSRGDEARGAYELERIAHAKKIMQPFVLRRLKKDVLLQLPKKTEQTRLCQMIPDQEEQYERIRSAVSREVYDDSSGVQARVGLSLLMKLRKVANHPLLERNHYSDDDLTTLAEKIAQEPTHLARNALPAVIQEDMQVMSDFELHKLCIFYKEYIGGHALDSSVIEESGKFRILDSMLPKMKKLGDRVLLFSQFRIMLDIIEEYLIQKDMEYLRLDGSTPVSERLLLIDKYNEDPSIFIFLLSTRAGGLGINLATANKVIIHDIDYNPYNDRQAEDRCHRLGQTRDVEVTKLISVGTVEEAMQQCAAYKLQLERDVTYNLPHKNTDDQMDKQDMSFILRQALRLDKEKTNKILPDTIKPKATENSQNDDDSIFPQIEEIQKQLPSSERQISCCSNLSDDATVILSQYVESQSVENNRDDGSRLECMETTDSGKLPAENCDKPNGVGFGEMKAERNSDHECLNGDVVDLRDDVLNIGTSVPNSSADAPDRSVGDVNGRTDRERLVTVIDLCESGAADGRIHTPPCGESGISQSPGVMTNVGERSIETVGRVDGEQAPSTACDDGSSSTNPDSLWVDLTANGDSADSSSVECMSENLVSAGVESVIDLDGSSNDTLAGVEALPETSSVCKGGMNGDVDASNTRHFSQCNKPTVDLT